MLTVVLAIIGVAALVAVYISQFTKIDGYPVCRYIRRRRDKMVDRALGRGRGLRVDEFFGEPTLLFSGSDGRWWCVRKNDTFPSVAGIEDLRVMVYYEVPPKPVDGVTFRRVWPALEIYLQGEKWAVI